MTGSSSTNRQPLGQQSSLDALSRTIEGLEARIEGLVARQSVRPADATVDTADPSAYGDGGEIVRRQRILERERANLQARLDARRAARAPGPDAAPASPQGLREIADALVEIRAELRRDVGEGLPRELKALRDEIQTMSAAAAQAPMPAAMATDLMRLADCIELLSERAVPSDETALRADFEALGTMIANLATRASVDALDEKWSGLSARLEGFEPDVLADGITALADRLDLLRDAIARLPGTQPTEELEGRLKAVATAVEGFARQGSLDDSRDEARFNELAERLDEISRAIVAVGAKADRTPGDEILARLETRVEGLSRQIDDLFDRDFASDLAERVQALSARLDGLASDASVTQLGEQLEALAEFMARPDQDTLTEHLSRISDRIDALDRGAVDTGLAERLDQLSRRIEAVAAQTERFEEAAFERLDALAERGIGGGLLDSTALEARLAEIVRHLEGNQHAAPSTDEALQALEARIADLAELLTRSTHETGSSDAFAPRLAAIEEHLATTDEYVIEAARQAAESVIEAYGRSGASAAGGDDAASEAADLSVIAELAQDLHALQALSQRSEQRSSRAFDAVHDTLLKIAQRLERLEPGRVPAPEETNRAAEGEVAVEAARPVIRAAARADDAASRPAGNRTAIVTPAEAAAEAAVFALHDAAADQADAPKPARTSFLKGLGRRIRPQRHAPSEKREEPALRQDLGETPSIDPSDSFEGVSANEPLEPGSGAPDISRIVQKVREAQRGEPRDRNGSENEQAEFIAAARRAAQAAAAEAETIGRGKVSGKGRGLAEILKQRRRPILMAVGAVLVVLMSLPLVSALRAPHRAQVAALARPLAHPQAGRSAEIARAAATNAAVAAEAARADRSATRVDGAATASTTAEGVAAAPVTAGGTSVAAAPAVSPAAEATAAQDNTQAQASSTSLAPAAEGSGAPAAAAAMPSVAKAEEAAAPADAPVAREAAATAPVAETASALSPLPAVPAEIGPQSLKAAAEKGEPVALFEIGARYNDGRGVDVDLAAAARWYKAAAERGLAPAQYRLGNLYEKGNGVARDVDAAKAWYEKAAAQGNASAMHNLAVIAASGTAGSGDFAAAARWFKDAAEHGVKDSQFNLGILYAQGRGVPRDLAQSYKWFAIAALDGDKDASEKRDAVASALKAPELTAMQASVKAWKPVPLDPAANSVPVPPEWAGTDTKTSSVDMTRAIRNIQAILGNNGFDAGKPDGIMGAKTVAAIKAFQTSIGQKPTGEITDALIRELLDRNVNQAKKKA